MNDILERSCGLDVHKEKIVANILSGPLGTTPSSNVSKLRDMDLMK
ncbi:hypothetical protein QYZ88_013770 [Lachnospiraceae bacterium C1.1]|nr:hypothetical protein [Lachnospiraceae bacterium C1.1]